MSKYDKMSIAELEQLARTLPKPERIPVLRAIAKRENNYRQSRGGGSARALTEVNYGLHDL